MNAMLEWKHFEKTGTGFERWTGSAYSGKWHIYREEEGYTLRNQHSDTIVLFPTLGSAQAAAQADFETRCPPFEVTDDAVRIAYAAWEKSYTETEGSSLDHMRAALNALFPKIGTRP